jgi:hypothetical protein
MRRKISDDAFAPKKPDPKAAPKAPPKASKLPKPRVVRMQVSFVMPDEMLNKTQAVKFVLGAIQEAGDAAELPALAELQVIPFSTP